MASKNKIKAPKLTKEQRDVEEEIQRRAASIQEKHKQLETEAAELKKLQRDNIVKTVDRLQLHEPELNAFMSAFDGWPNKNDISVALINAAHGNSRIDMQQFQVKLIRMGLL